MTVQSSIAGSERVASRHLPSGVLLFGRFGPPFLAAARAFARAGIRVSVLEISDREPTRRSNAVAAVYRMPPEQVGADAGIATLVEVLGRAGAEAVLPLSDVHLLWLAARRNSLPAGCELLCSGLESLQFVLSKKNQIELARACGFDVLPTWELWNADDACRIPAAEFPVCVRPSDPDRVMPTFKAEVLRSREELELFLRARVWAGEPLLAQPFRPVPNLLVHGIRSRSGEILAMRGFLVDRKFEGLALRLSDCTLGAGLAATCADFVSRAGVVGPFHFDLLHDEQERKDYFLEINARIGGTTDKVSRLGFDEPCLTLSAFGFRGGDPARGEPRRGAVVNRKAIAKHIVWALAGKLSPLDYPPTGRWRQVGLSIADLLLATDSIASFGDLKGTLWFYFR